ncbi:MAG: precorrin-6y C5,15-methyltransferase (decarboxylating) subunit CbiE [Polyangiales bacterium]
MSDPQPTDPLASAPWLTLVGLGADGVPSLSEAARTAVSAAHWVVGSGRQLALVAELVRGETFAWPSPLSGGIARLLALRGTPTCVLASGDPFFFGIGATLAPHLARGEFVALPAPSSVSLAASRLGWPLQDVEVISLHGRDLHGIVPTLAPGRRVIALSWDARTPAALAELLRARGFGASRIHVLENLGAADERVRAALADAFALDDVADLNLVALEVEAPPTTFAIPVRGSLPDEAFANDGQLTKQDVRAITLSALAPRPGELLWDVGAGAGSIAIEWMLGHAHCRAIAIEHVPARAARIRDNARNLGVPALVVHEARAPEGLAGLPTPNAIFIGGGARNPALFEACWRALPSGGRLVINAVTLEGEAHVIGLHAAHGGQLVRVSIERAGAVGTLTGWRAAMPVVQWRVTKP